MTQVEIDLEELYGKLPKAVITVALTSIELEYIEEIMKKEKRNRSAAVRLLIRRGYAYTKLLESNKLREIVRAVDRDEL